VTAAESGPADARPADLRPPILVAGAGRSAGMAARVVRSPAPLGRLGVPRDCANPVTFLCPPQGGWTTGRLPHSGGGF
jgi:NAD(P)-dependent dehydrogenase (short-subunit alcohol dehydrogenase family)